MHRMKHARTTQFDSTCVLPKPPINKIKPLLKPKLNKSKRIGACLVLKICNSLRNSYEIKSKYSNLSYRSICVINLTLQHQFGINTVLS